MKIVIHAGMPKTGSTAIQRAFAGLRQERYTWAPADEPHHNYLFSLVFDGAAEAFRQHALYTVLGASADEVRAKAARYRRRLDDAMRAARRPLFLFSAERISGRFAAATRRFADYCRRFTDDIQVIVYARRPVAFMQSWREQALRSPTHVAADTPLLIWPEYRRRFEALRDAFGARRVRFKLYDRARLQGGDVALDFAAEVGVPLAAGDVVRANDSIGLEAAACVFAFKSLLPPRRPRCYRRDWQSRFHDALRPLSTTKLRFTRQAVAPILREQRDDLAWMENVLGEPLADPPRPAAGQIGGMAELLSIADEQAAAAEELAGVSAPIGASKRRRLLYALTALYDRADGGAER